MARSKTVARRPAGFPEPRRRQSTAAERRAATAAAARTGTDIVRAARGRSLKHHDHEAGRLPVPVRIAHRGHRHRAGLAPFYTAAAMTGTGALLHVVPYGAPVSIAIGALPSMVAAVRRGVLVHRARKEGREARLMPDAAWGWAAWSARAGVAAWLPITAFTGWNPVVDWSLLGLVPGSAAWWSWLRARRNQIIDVEVIEEEPEQIEAPGEGMAAVWARRLAQTGGALPDSVLSDVEETDKLRRATMHFAGDQTWHDAQTALVLRKIARHFGVPESAVSIMAPSSGHLDHAKLEIYLNDPLSKVQTFEGPSLDPDTGWIVVGRYPDGSPALWRLWVPGSGVCHGSICGTTGSGKSGLVNVLCTEIAHSGVAVLWVGDGQDGLSVPEWQENGVDWFAPGIVKTRRMLQAAEQVMKGRQKRRRKQRWKDEKGRERKGFSSFTPSEECPALYIVLDEAPALLSDPEIARIVALIGKQGRKVGVAVIIVTQVPSVTEMGGSGDGATLRSMLSSMNIAMFRVSGADRQTKMMGGLGADFAGVNPESLPPAFSDGSPTTGLGYLRSATVTTTSPMRGMFVVDPLDWAIAADAIGMKLEPEAYDDAGPDYDEWRDLVDEDEEDVEDAEGAEDDQWDEPGRAAKPAPGTSKPAAANWRRLAVMVLRGEPEPLATPEVARRVKLAADTDVTVNTIMTALKRAAEVGEVEKLDPTPGEKASRWRIPAEDRELVDA